MVDFGFPIVVVDANPVIDNLNGEVKENITFHKIRITTQNFFEFLCDDINLVIIALGEKYLSRRIALYCQEKGIPVNVVDTPEISSITFSSIIKSNSLCVSISTQGTCPFFAKQLRKDLSPYIKKKANHLKVLAILRKESSNPKEELQHIYDNIEFQRYLSNENYEGALLLGRNILGIER